MLGPVANTLFPNAGGVGFNPYHGADPTCLMAKKSKHKQKKYCHKFNKHFQRSTSKNFKMCFE